MKWQKGDRFITNDKCCWPGVEGTFVKYFDDSIVEVEFDEPQEYGAKKSPLHIDSIEPIFSIGKKVIYNNPDCPELHNKIATLERILVDRYYFNFGEPIRGKKDGDLWSSNIILNNLHTLTFLPDYISFDGIFDLKHFQPPLPSIR